jgi:hypothetical protein
MLLYMPALVLLLQYHSYHDSAVIYAMQGYLDAKHPTLCAYIDDKNSNDSGSNDGYLVEKTNSN